MFILMLYPFLDVSHLIGPNSCLCSSCFKSIEKRSYKNDIKTPCMITSCTNKAYHLFKSPVMKKIKSLIEKEGVIYFNISYLFV